MKNKRFIAIVVILLFSLNLPGCKDQGKEMSEFYIEDITEIKSDELMKYKDSYVGDNSAVINIVSGLPGNRYETSFHLKTKEEPYEIAVRYQVNEEREDESYLNFWTENNPEELLENNAIVLFSLIQNVDLITFGIDGIDNLQDHTYGYSRKELESEYNLDLRDLTVSQDSLDDFFKNKE